MSRHYTLGRRQAATAIALLPALSGAAQAAPDTITVALPGEFPRLDPSKDTSPLGFNFRLNVFDALTQQGRDGKISPRLAESWSFSSDLTEWTFVLRKGVI